MFVVARVGVGCFFVMCTNFSRGRKQNSGLENGKVYKKFNDSMARSVSCHPPGVRFGAILFGRIACGAQ